MARAAADFLRIASIDGASDRRETMGQRAYSATHSATRSPAATADARSIVNRSNRAPAQVVGDLPFDGRADFYITVEAPLRAGLSPPPSSPPLPTPHRSRVLYGARVSSSPRRRPMARPRSSANLPSALSATASEGAARGRSVGSRPALPGAEQPAHGHVRGRGCWATAPRVCRTQPKKPWRSPS